MRIQAAWLITVLLFLPPASAQDREPLDIGVGDRPFYFDRTQPQNGFIAHLVSDVLAAEGYDVTYHFLPWSRAYREAELEERDASAIWLFIHNQSYLLFPERNTRVLS